MKEMKDCIDQETYSSERALYAIRDTGLYYCRFEGIEDGESPLKEARNISLKTCYFDLRYPLWHVHHFYLEDVDFTIKSRAPLWYDIDGEIINSRLLCPKAVRECRHINIAKSTIVGQEFGWKCRDIKVSNSTLESEYAFLDSRDLILKNVTFKGKYSFQYVHNLTIEDSNFDTKDAFWHTKNVTVRNSIIKGEYLGWYSENLTLTNCTIIGTQPLCYCKGLKLINCKMIDADLAFEYSDVNATIIGTLVSIKNPLKGEIHLEEPCEIIRWGSVHKDTCKIFVKDTQFFYINH